MREAPKRQGARGFETSKFSFREPVPRSKPMTRNLLPRFQNAAAQVTGLIVVRVLQFATLPIAVPLPVCQWATLKSNSPAPTTANLKAEPSRSTRPDISMMAREHRGRPSDRTRTRTRRTVMRPLSRSPDVSLRLCRARLGLELETRRHSSFQQKLRRSSGD